MGRLGAELQRLGLVAAEPVLRALAAQGGVSYLPTFDVGRVTRGPAWLPAETVRALGVVPFEVDDLQKKIRVVCAAPVPRTAMCALLKLTGWTAEARSGRCRPAAAWGSRAMTRRRPPAP